MDYEKSLPGKILICTFELTQLQYRAIRRNDISSSKFEGSVMKGLQQKASLLLESDVLTYIQREID